MTQDDWDELMEIVAFMQEVPPGPPVGCEYRVPADHPCYGCRMYANPCVYPCNKFREHKLDRTADEFVIELEERNRETCHR